MKHASTCALLLATLALDGCGGSKDGGSTSTAAVGKPVETGTLDRWPEATEHLTLDFATEPAVASLGQARPSGLDAFWSIASTSGAGSGFFYADFFRTPSETRVAQAKAVARVADIRDASAFDYSQRSVGPVAPGDVVLVHHLPSDRYLAIVIDAIHPADARTAGAGPYAFADVRWYLSAAGSPDFSAAP
jgi:hypothetical protein